MLSPYNGMTVATAPFRGESGNRDFSKHAAYGTSRYRHARASARKLQCVCSKSSAFLGNSQVYMVPRKLTASTNEAHLAVAKKKQFKPVSISLPYGGKADSLGNEKADRIMFVPHGEHHSPRLWAKGITKLGEGYVKRATNHFDLL